MDTLQKRFEEYVSMYQPLPPPHVMSRMREFFFAGAVEYANLYIDLIKRKRDSRSAEEEAKILNDWRALDLELLAYVEEFRQQNEAIAGGLSAAATTSQVQ
jgi:hypothetical protein